MRISQVNSLGVINDVATGTVSSPVGSPPVTESVTKDGRTQLSFTITTSWTKSSIGRDGKKAYAYDFESKRCVIFEDKKGRNSAMVELVRSLQPSEIVTVTGRLYQDVVQTAEGEIPYEQINVDAVYFPERLAVLCLGGDVTNLSGKYIPKTSRAEKQTEDEEFDFQ